MSKNSETLNRKLYELLRSRGFKPTGLSTAGKVTPVPEEAAVFQFNFVKDGEDYGKVSITIDGPKKLIIYYGDDVANSPDTNTSGTPYSDSWIALINQLKNWSQRRQLGFDLQNEDHLESDMAKREHMKKKENIAEGYHAMGRKSSYNDSVPSVKIILQHSRALEEGEQRFRAVEKIFVETAQGERFLLDTTRPGLARVYARHIAEGGTPYDDRAKHIHSLVEEYEKMAGFVRATRNGQFNESAQQLVQEGVNHYLSLRESLGKLTGHRGYTTYFENWTPSLMEDETDTNALNELFVQETLDPRIESVMPILSRIHKQVSEMKEVNELSEWADSLLEGGDGGEASEETDTDTDGAAGEGGAEDVNDEENISESDTVALNPVGIPEGIEDHPVVNAIIRRILMQRADLLSNFGPVKVAQAITDVADFVGDVEEIGSSDVSGWVKQVERELGGNQFEEMKEAERPGLWANIHAKRERIKHGSGEKMRKPGSKGAPTAQNFRDAAKEGVGDTLKKVGQKVLTKLGHGSDEELLKDLQKKAGVPSHAQHGKPSMAKPNEGVYEEEVDESGLQAYLGNKKYGKEGMDALRKAGREHAGKEKMANIRAKYDKVDEGEFAGHYKTGPEGQWRNKGPKANKPAKVGDLVGANESVEQGVAEGTYSKDVERAFPGGKASGVKTGASAPKGTSTMPKDKEKAKGKPAGAITEMDKSVDNKGPEAKGKPITASKAKKDFGKILQKSVDKHNKAKQDTDKKVAQHQVKEGQEDLDAILRIIKK